MKKTSFTFFVILFGSIIVVNAVVDKSFYIRHHSGKCLSFDTSSGTLVFHSICSEKFRWGSGSRLVHEITSNCISPISANSGSNIGLSNCSGSGSLYTYNQRNRKLVHLQTEFCLQPSTGAESPADNENLIFKEDCASDTSKFYFVARAYYVIRHKASSFCWVYDTEDDRLELMNTYVCDRFEYINSKHLRHVASGKCVQAKENGDIGILPDCTSTKSIHNLLSSDILHSPEVDKCVRPNSDSTSPPEKDQMVYSACSVVDKYQWEFHDDRDILKIKIISESCDEYGGVNDCSSRAKGHIIVNGYQYSYEIRGINVVVFDYKSSVPETQVSFDVHGSIAARNELADFINSIPPNRILLMAVKDAIGMNNNLALALQKVGVSATFATTSLPKTRLSMATVTYTGEARYSWEKSINKLGGTGASVIQTIIYSFRDFEGIDECYEEMGLRTRKLTDDKLSAISVYRGSASLYAPSFARLHNTKAWCSGSTLSDYIQVDLGSIKSITGLATQPFTDRHIMHNIIRFYLTYSKDGVTWKEYMEYGNTRKELFGNMNIKRSIKVNWLARTQLRFLRIIPLERYTDLNTHCLRLELFGCDQRDVILNDEMFTNETYKIIDHKVVGFDFHGFTTDNKSVSIEVSTGKNNTSLANYINLFNFYEVNEHIINSDGRQTRGTAKITKKIENQLRMKNVFQIEYPNIQPDNYQFTIQTGLWVIDSQLEDGQAWQTYSFEADESITVFSHPIEIRRRSPDRAQITFDVTNTKKQWYEAGDQLLLNTSLSSQIGDADWSPSNAFQLEQFIYYDTQFLSLNSMNTIEMVNSSLSPSHNTSKQGFIHLHNDVFGPFNSQLVNFNFQFSIPDHLKKADKCNGEIMIEFKYRTNSAKFDGKWNTTLKRLIQYTCKVIGTQTRLTTTARLAVPTYSVAYDDLNRVLVVCKKRLLKEFAHLPSCYLQMGDDVTWKGVSQIASVAGIDTTKRYVYGIDLYGSGYRQSMQTFHEFGQVDDEIWTGIKDMSHVRRAKETNNNEDLPSLPANEWSFPSTGEAVIAMTKRGIHKKIDGTWKRVFQF